MLSWELSNTLDVGFCLQALATALRQAPAPYIFNSDQGKFICPAFEQALLDAGCRISRDGWGRATDNTLSVSGALSSGSTSTSIPPTAATTCITNYRRTLLTTITVDPTKV